MVQFVAASLLTLLAADVRQAWAALQPNPPSWPESVKVFGPETDAAIIKSAVDQAYVKNGGHVPTDHGQFSSSRFAFLFKPGTYSVDVPVGYYTQVLGLGVSPEEVIFAAPKGPHCEEGDQKDMGGALSTFWRGAENFRTKSPQMLWAVSQAAPLRRIIADGNLNLAEFVGGVGMGYSSGGFVANTQVKGTMFPGSQQQFCTRNAAVGKWAGGVWNMAFIGTVNAPQAHCGQEGGVAAVTLDRTPLIAEKPFISIGPDGKYSLHVPRAKRDRVGVDLDPGDAFGFEQVYVARDTDSAQVINAHLSDGQHVVLTPGIYHLEAPLELSRDNQVLLGLGLATLVSANGNQVVRVGNVNGVRIAGVLLQAGPQDTPSLLEWGAGGHPGDAQNPGFLHDVFARVGGPTNPAVEQVRAEVMVRITSGHVVGDNLWLWRADHSKFGLTRNSDNPVRTGLVVTGDNVRMYGLAVEHTLEDQVRWSGNNGATYFFQSELPYDVTEDFGNAGYVGYRVLDNVRSHQAFGIGVYHFFRDHAVTVDHGVSVPPWLESSFHSPLSVYLTGKGKMLHVMNKQGGSTGHGLPQVQWACLPVPSVPVPAVLPGPPTGPLEKPGADGHWQVINDAPAGGSLPWWVPVIALQLILVCMLAAYLQRFRIRRAGEEAVAAAFSPSGATGKRAKFMNTPKRSPTESPPSASPPLDPALVASVSEARQRGGEGGLWGVVSLMLNCVPKSRQQRPAFFNNEPAPPVSPEKSKQRKSGFPGLSPGGPDARTLSAGASPVFGFSPFGRRSPHWRPEEV